MVAAVGRIVADALDSQRVGLHEDVLHAQFAGEIGGLVGLIGGIEGPAGGDGQDVLGPQGPNRQGENQRAVDASRRRHGHASGLVQHVETSVQFRLKIAG